MVIIIGFVKNVKDYRPSKRLIYCNSHLYLLYHLKGLITEISMLRKINLLNLMILLISQIIVSKLSQQNNKIHRKRYIS